MYVFAEKTRKTADAYVEYPDEIPAVGTDV